MNDDEIERRREIHRRAREIAADRPTHHALAQRSADDSGVIHSEAVWSVPEQPEPEPEIPHARQATLAEQWERRIASMIDERIEHAIDEIFDEIGTVIGENLRGIDKQFKEITDKLFDEAVIRQTKDSDRDDRTLKALEKIRKSLAALEKRTSSSDSGSNIRRLHAS